MVVGENELPLDDAAVEGAFDDAVRKAADSGTLRVVGETWLWQRLGLVDLEQHVHQLYTPAMLAQLLKVPTLTIRLWQRRGWIVAKREVRRLAYFDFQEVATARCLTELLAAGVSASAIERKLAELNHYLPGIKRPLAQLSIIVEGKSLLLRRGDALVEPGGQRRFDFNAVADDPSIAAARHGIGRHLGADSPPRDRAAGQPGGNGPLGRTT